MGLILWCASSGFVVELNQQQKATATGIRPVPFSPASKRQYKLVRESAPCRPELVKSAHIQRMWSG